MISIKSFLKEATIYSLSNFLNKAITIFLLPLYTHYLTPGEFGMFDFILITINLKMLFLMVIKIITKLLLTPYMFWLKLKNIK